MKLLIQWTKKNATDWLEVDSSQWASFVKDPVPVGGETIDDSDGGYVYALNIQGMRFRGADHYYVEELPPDHEYDVRVVVWADDPDDYAPEDFWAEEWYFKKLAPDAKFGNAYNTSQISIGYFSGASYDRKIANGPYDSREIKQFSDFVPPTNDVAHGVWVTDAQSEAHDKKQAEHGWREWTEGVDETCIEDGKVCQQRKIGRYNKPDGTRTWYASDTTQATASHTGDRELAFLATTGSAQSISATLDATTPNNEQWIWTTGAVGNGEDDWPSGNYRFQIDCTTADSEITYGIKTLNSVAGHFARLDSFPTYADAQTWEQTEGTFSGTGLKLATTGTINPSAGAETDAWEVMLNIYSDGSAMHGTATFTQQVNETDDFTDGPWADLATQVTITCNGDIKLVDRLTTTCVGDIKLVTRNTTTCNGDIAVIARPTIDCVGDIIVVSRLTTACVGDIVLNFDRTVACDGDIKVVARPTTVCSGDIVVSAGTTQVTIDCVGDIIVVSRLTTTCAGDIVLNFDRTTTTDGDIIVVARLIAETTGNIIVVARLTTTCAGDIVLNFDRTTECAGDIIVQPWNLYRITAQQLDFHNGPVGAATKVEAMDDPVGSPDYTDYIWWQKSGTLQTKTDTWDIEDQHFKF